MIDYEKLKIAVEKVNNIKLAKLIFSYSEYDGVKYSLVHEEDSTTKIFRYTNIDELIEKLAEPKPKAKYEVNSIAWYINDEGYPKEVYIHAVDFSDNSHKYYMYDCAGDGWILEKDLYPTKQALIDAKMAHWQSFQYTCGHENEIVSLDGKTKCNKCNKILYEKCEHEPKPTYGEQFDYQKCIKCGVLYR
jgi:hypothetical protein